MVSKFCISNFSSISQSSQLTRESENTCACTWAKWGKGKARCIMGNPKPGEGTPWWGCAARFSKFWPYFRPKKNVNFHTRFQTWRRSQNVTIYMLTSHKTEIMSPLLKLERQQKDFLKSISSSHIRLSLISYSLGIETTNTSLHTVVPS